MASFLFKSRRALLVFAALFAFQVASFAQAARPSISAQTALVTELDVNGLKVLIKKRPGSATVSAGLFFRGGAKNLTAQNAGIESFMLNVAAEGSQKFPRDVMRRELSRTGGGIASGSNYDFSVLSLASTREHFDRSWEIFTDVALNPAFAASDVELTRQKILTAMRNQEDDPDGFLQALADRSLHAKTSYENDPSGSAETIGKFKIEDLRAYHKAAMQTSRLLLVVVGDIDSAALQPLITASFGKLPRGDYKETVSAGFDFSKPTVDITQRSLPTNYIQGVFNAPSVNSPDYHAMRVATTILRDRVFEEVRVKRNLSYAPSADMGNLNLNSGSIYVSAVDANQAVTVMLNEINSLKTTPVEAHEISGVSGQFLTTYFIGQETNAAQAGELARYELIGGGWKNSFQFLDKVREVKPADIQAVATKYMKNIRFIVVGNPSQIDRTLFLKV